MEETIITVKLSFTLQVYCGCKSTAYQWSYSCYSQTIFYPTFSA